MKFVKLLLIAVACVGCSNTLARKNVDLSQGLPLPEIPNTLQTPQDRADYLVAHYWDDMDFANPTYALDTTFMEPAFVEYASVLPVATQGAKLQNSVDSLFVMAAIDPRAYKFMGNIAEKYLYEIESPVYSEDMYLYFVNAQLANDLIPDGNRARLEYQRQCLNMNQRGTQVTDFEFITRDGKKHHLHEYPVQATKTLLIFFDPDCDDCHQLMDFMQDDQWINNAISNKWLNVIAIANFETRDRWNETKDAMPETWIVGCDITDVESNDLYYLPHTPTLLVLDHNGIVIVKNLQPQPTMEALM